MVVDDYAAQKNGDLLVAVFLPAEAGLLLIH